MPLRMIHTFAADSADDVYRQLVGSAESWEAQDSRFGATREQLRVIVELKNPRNRWITCRHPRINPAFAIVEAVWILSGDNSLNFLLPWNKKLSDYVGYEPEVYGAYGRRLRSSLGFDQLTVAAEALTMNPTSRQVVLQIWNSLEDLPIRAGEPRSSDIPCNVISMLKVRNGLLEWTQTMRSNDLFRGFPYNVVQFTILQEVMAGWIGVDVGSYVQYCDSLHIYDRDTLALASPVAEVEADLDLRLSYAQFSNTLIEAYTLVERLAQTRSNREIEKLAMVSLGNAGWDSLLAVVKAEAARRRGLWDLASELLQPYGGQRVGILQRLWLDEKRFGASTG